MANDTDKNNYYDDQDVDFDIDEIYNSFVAEIEGLRSRFTIPQQVNLDVLDEKKLQTAVAGNRAENLPTESLCSTFYRMLGLPIISSAGIYNPGFSQSSAKPDNRTKQFTIANALTGDVRKMFNEREKYPKDQLSITSTSYTLDGSALILSTKYFRPITGIIKNDDPLAYEPQSFTVDDRVKIADNYDPSRLSSPVRTTFPHVLKPFMPDPKICFTVFPLKCRIAAPFLPDRQRAINSNEMYKKPLIETVCRTRLNIDNDDDATVSLSTLIDAVKNNSSITNNILIGLTGGISKYFRSDANTFRNLLNVIEATVSILAASLQTVDSVMQQMHFVPIPDATGVENGVTAMELLSLDPLGKEIEQKLSLLTVLSIASDTHVDIPTSTGGVSQGGAVMAPTMSNLDGIALGSALKNIPTKYARQIKYLKNIRSQLGEAGSKAIQNINVIMGDVTGLGLIDILAIYSALWVVDKNILVGLLDDDDILRLATIPELQSSEVKAAIGGSKMNPISALTGFQTKTIEMFNLIDYLLQNKLTNHKKT